MKEIFQWRCLAMGYTLYKQPKILRLLHSQWDIPCESEMWCRWIWTWDNKYIILQDMISHHPLFKSGFEWKLFVLTVKNEGLHAMPHISILGLLFFVSYVACKITEMSDSRNSGMLWNIRKRDAIFFIKGTWHLKFSVVVISQKTVRWCKHGGKDTPTTL